MNFYIDSANIEDVSKAVSFGWVKGVTTNPLLLARESAAVEEVLNRIKQLSSGPIFYQLFSKTVEDMLVEALAVKEILGEQLVVKILPTEAGYRFCSTYSGEYICCLTALFSAAQAAAAQQAGARYIAIYFNRAQKKMGNGIGLIEAAAQVLKGSGTEVVAASIKNTDEASQVLLAGALHIAAPLNVLTEMMKHNLSHEAITDFYENGVGL
jgi:transaldolase